MVFLGIRPDRVTHNGPATVLSEQEESHLRDWIVLCAGRSFGKSKQEIRMQVKELLDLAGRKEPRFKDNLPGRKWMDLFMQRHPELRTKVR